MVDRMADGTIHGGAQTAVTVAHCDAGSGRRPPHQFWNVGDENPMQHAAAASSRRAGYARGPDQPAYLDGPGGADGVFAMRS